MNIKKFLGAGIAALSLLAFQGTPASAATVGAGVFTGIATLADAGSGLDYPVSPNCGTPVGVCPNGRTGTWDLDITGGVGVATDGSAVAAGIMDGAVSGDLHANVVGVGAFCGVSGGSSGDGNLVVDQTATAVTGIGWKTSAATVIVFENLLTKTSGPTVVGVASAIPPLPVVGSGSCLNGTAINFTVVGAAALAG